MNRFEKAAEFGARMGKQAGLGSALGVGLSRSGILNTPTAAGAGIGALVGGGGTALYDYLAGTEEGKLRRALTGAGVGGLVGALAGGSVHKKDEAKREDQKHLASVNKKKEEEAIDHMIARASNKAREEVYNSRKANIPPKEKLSPKEISAKWLSK
jgi:hypothetical protein